jgi:tRNA1Val (adenine37-N6)-methyltransferase
MKVNSDSVLLGSWVDTENAKKILDIGAGTGLIALMMAQRTNALIDAVEIDKSACEQARDNILNSPWPDRITLHQSSFQDYAQKTNEKFDLIVTNPPYFVNSLKSAEINRTIARHSDTLTHNDLLRYTAKILDESGHFALIISQTEGIRLIAEAINYGLYCQKKLFVKSTEEQKTSRILIEFKKMPCLTKEETIIISSGKPKEYSAKYKKLTGDFYLNF